MAAPRAFGAGAAALAALIATSGAWARSDTPPADTAATAQPAAKGAPAAVHAKPAPRRTATKPAPAAGAHEHYRPDRFAGRAGKYYRLVWGVDDLIVKWGESGEVIRFSYRVLDAGKAKALNDKKNEPSLIDPQAGVSLVVPSMENVGQLRQSTPPENGKSYWMVFSNKGRLVKRGHHVNVVIGAFHADGLVVD
ncbi:MAG TPA: hypothetical protein VEU54_07260 [Steroidobacteraceae bacterium]|nr:hypothetical protein [Steroidobacteraceae bacterium]